MREPPTVAEALLFPVALLAVSLLLLQAQSPHDFVDVSMLTGITRGSG